MTCLQIGYSSVIRNRIIFSNRLPEMFEKTADICSTRLESCFKKIQTWLEPVMIVFVGIIVALVLVSMYLPMFKMGTTILGN